MIQWLRQWWRPRIVGGFTSVPIVQGPAAPYVVIQEDGWAQLALPAGFSFQLNGTPTKLL
jgi:hypothetical protein